jgi:ribonuclease P protein component
MLRSPRDFAALQTHGRTRSHPLLTIRLRRNELGRDRYGIATGKRLGSAVVRNRVRRRIREILRLMERSTSPGWDILVVARPGSVAASYADLAHAVERSIRPAVTREGIVIR